MAKAAAPKKAPTKAEIYKAIVEDTDLPRKDVVAVCDSLTEQMSKSLKKNGEFNLLGLAKMTVVKKPAVKVKPGEMTKNPFTGEMVPKKAKPASKNVKIRPLKTLKDTVDPPKN